MVLVPGTSLFCYAPIFTAHKRSLGEGNSFRSVCQEFCPQGGRSHGTPLARRLPWQGDPLERRTPWQGDPPAGRTPWQGDLPAKDTPQQGDPCQGDPPAKETPPSRPTPRMEIEGDQVQAHNQGGN